MRLAMWGINYHQQPPHSARGTCRQGLKDVCHSGVEAEHGDCLNATKHCNKKRLWTALLRINISTSQPSMGYTLRQTRDLAWPCGMDGATLQCWKEACREGTRRVSRWSKSRPFDWHSRCQLCRQQLAEASEEKYFPQTTKSAKVLVASEQTQVLTALWTSHRHWEGPRQTQSPTGRMR